MGRHLDVDDLLTLDDIAALLGLANGRVVSVLRSRHPDFPAPVFERQRCNLWHRTEVERWAKATGRLTG